MANLLVRVLAVIRTQGRARDQLLSFRFCARDRAASCAAMCLPIIQAALNMPRMSVCKVGVDCRKRRQLFFGQPAIVFHCFRHWDRPQYGSGCVECGRSCHPVGSCGSGPSAANHTQRSPFSDLAIDRARRHRAACRSTERRSRHAAPCPSFVATGHHASPGLSCTALRERRASRQSAIGSCSSIQSNASLSVPVSFVRVHHGSSSPIGPNVTRQ